MSFFRGEWIVKHYHFKINFRCRYSLCKWCQYSDRLLKQIPDCANCEANDVSSCLDYDGVCRISAVEHDEIIAKVRKPNSDDDNSESDEVIDISKIKQN